MNLAEYSQYDALELADLVHRKAVKPAELASLALQAIETPNPEINAVIGILPGREDEADLPEGPFTGVPFLIKDLVLHAAGVQSDLGSRLIQGGFIPPHDTDLMARYKQAGLVTLGRTNTPEFGLNINTEPLLYGPTRNPWNTSKTAGGSSGGSSAAVAARIVPVAHANDGGGSIRVPASCCGLFGMKPTRGRTPAGPDVAEGVHGFGIEHAVTRTVRDSAALLDATEGPGVGDNFVIARPTRPYLEEVTTPPGNLKIAFTSQAWSGVDVDPACAKAVEEAAHLCESLGHTLVEASPPCDMELFFFASQGVWAAATAAGLSFFGQMLGRTPSPKNLEATTWAAYQHGLQMSAMDLESALGACNQISRAVGHFFLDYDMLLSPTLAQQPANLGVYNANDPDMDIITYLQHLFSFAAFTPLFNMTGQPAMSVPLHQSESGLPVGVQFAARYGDEATLFRLAGQLEQAQPWIGRKPKVSI